MNNAKHILVLGGSGFIALNFIDELIHSGRSEEMKISVLTRSHSADLSKLCKDHPNIQIHTGDYCDEALMDSLSSNVDIAYHFISGTYPHSSWNDPLSEIEINLVPTLKLLDTLGKNKVKKIVFLSSAGTIYGINEGVLNEKSLPDPFSPHAIFKLTIEKFLNYYRQRFQLNYDIYRVSNPYGPYQDTRKGLGFINTALANIIKTKTLTIYGDGKAVRDFIYVKDVARLLTLSLKKPLSESDLFVISAGKSYSLNDVAEKIKRAIPAPFEIVHIHQRPGDNKTVQLDNSRVLDAFEEITLVPLEEGIRKTYEHLLQAFRVEEKS